MTTRDILDTNGNVVGQLTLPDDTSEDVWQQKLAIYLYIVPAPDPTIVIQDKIKAAMKFGKDLITAKSATQIQMGIVQAGKAKDVLDYTVNLVTYLMAGSLIAAEQEIDSLIAAGIPDELSPFVTIDTLNDTKQKIINFLAQ